MKLWTKNMRTSNISGPISSNKVLKRMAMGRKAAETHTNTRLDRAYRTCGRRSPADSYNSFFLRFSTSE